MNHFRRGASSCPAVKKSGTEEKPRGLTVFLASVSRESRQERRNSICRDNAYCTTYSLNVAHRGPTTFLSPGRSSPTSSLCPFRFSFLDISPPLFFFHSVHSCYSTFPSYCKPFPMFTLRVLMLFAITQLVYQRATLPCGNRARHTLIPSPSSG